MAYNDAVYILLVIIAKINIHLNGMIFQFDYL